MSLMIAVSALTFLICFALGYISGRFKTAMRDLGIVRRERDTAYEDRARILAVMASQYPSSLEHDSTEPSDSEWLWVLIIQLPKVFHCPATQLSWHIKSSDLRWFDHVPRQLGYVWDGHSTVEKHQRMCRFCDARAGSTP